jgi:hypothetical protein
LKNKKSLEERYRDLLIKAETVKDILEIERNINQVRTEIEQLEGQFRYLSQQISYSTLHVNFYELLPYQYNEHNRPGFGARLLSGLNSGWQGFLSFIVGLFSIWPFVLLGIGGIVLVRRWRKKRKISK